MKTILHIIFILTLITSSCKTKKTFSFLDIESGKISLTESEKNEILNLINKYKINKKEFTVSTDNTGFSNINVNKKHITSVYFDNIKLEDISFVKKFPFLQKIYIYGSVVNKITGIENLHKLKTLILNNGKLNGTMQITNNNTIENVSFSNNIIDTLIIKNCDKLSNISCENNKLKYFCLENLKLQPSVYLKNNTISDFNIINSKLYLLDLTNNKLQNFPESFDTSSIIQLQSDINNNIPTKINNKKNTLGSANSISDIADNLENLIDSAEKSQGIKYTNDIRYSGSCNSGDKKYKSNINTGVEASIGSMTGQIKEEFESTKGGYINIILSVKKGTVRVFLKGKKGKGKFKYIDITENHTGSISGNAFTGSDLYKNYFYIKSLNGTAKGITYKIKYMQQ